MMYYNYYGPFEFLGGLLQFLLVIFVIVLAIRLIRGGRWHRWGDGRGWGWPGSSAEEILKERYAKGEISREEYMERLSVLRGETKHAGDAAAQKKS